MAHPNFRTLDLNLLRVFDAVMAEGSLTRAADQLAMTQPAVSNAMKRLRESLGEDLVRRTGHGVKPTGFALAVWPEVRASLARLRSSLARDAFDPADEATTFRIAAGDATATTLLPRLAAQFEARGCRARLDVVPLVTDDPRPLLLDGQADLAVGHFPEVMPSLLRQRDEVAFRHRHLAQSAYVCVMRRGHPLAGRPLTLDAYCEARHVRVSLTGHGHGRIDQALAAIGRSRRIAMTVNQFFTAAHVAANTELLTVLPREVLDSAAAGCALTARPLPFDSGGVPVDAVWHLRLDAHPAQQWLRERVGEAVAAALPEQQPLAAD